MNLKGKIIVFLSTGGYIGRIPFAPGTFGSLLGLVVCYLFSLFPSSISPVAAVMLLLLSIWVSEHAERLLDRKDPGCVVIDEVVGMVIAMMGIPLTGITAVGGFVLFRLFDIAKPAPVRFFQEKCKGGAGVVLDDVAAGVAANIVLRALCPVFGVSM